MVLNSSNRLLLATLSGMLLSCGWISWVPGIIILTGFVPLLFIEDYLDSHKKDYRSIVFFLYSLLSFFVWNLLNTWWIFNATFIGVMAVIIYNSLLMSIVMWGFHVIKRALGASIAYFCFVVFWLAFEKYYLSAELSWPWLHLGNAFGNDIKIIQWYEYTGVQGGTLWVLVINLFIFSCIKNYISSGRIILNKIIILLAIILIPIGFSLIKYYSYKEKEYPVNVAILQPNIDPYNNTSTELSENEILEVVLEMAKEVVDSTIDYVIIPEAAIKNAILESRINTNSSIISIRSFVEKYPKLHFITGISSSVIYSSENEKTQTAQKFEDVYYDRFNTAIQINNTDSVLIYHKSKLVTGVEKMPFPKLINVFGKSIEKMGGIPGSLGTQEERTVFPNLSKDINFAPIICYESVYGEFVNDFIHKGGSAIALITNDGWWGNTPGHKQHLSYSRIRAIETRRSIARSASTGISAIINQKGEIIYSTSFGEQAIIKGVLNSNKKLTFYVKTGDFIGRGAVFFSLIMLVYTLVVKIKKHEA